VFDENNFEPSESIAGDKLEGEPQKRKWSESNRDIEMCHECCTAMKKTGNVQMTTIVSAFVVEKDMTTRREKSGTRVQNVDSGCLKITPKMNQDKINLCVTPLDSSTRIFFPSENVVVDVEV
jgi:hypothetical protein